MIDLFNQKSNFLHSKSNFVNADGISQYIQPPDWQSISCDDFPDEIDKFKRNWVETYLKYAEAVGLTQSAQVSADGTTQNEMELEFQKEVENAQMIYDTKCSTSTSFVDEVVPREINPPNETPETPTETPKDADRMPNINTFPLNISTLGNNTEVGGGGGGGSVNCNCIDKELSNLGLILIGLGTLVLVYNSSKI
jgi:hypothetical protein